ncbi:hypothetical protein GH733_017444 [Mirounga leonina]|nr:hypothetical protein GH733_017444 [Mirounga leonina]
MSKNPGYIKLGKIQATRNISKTTATSQNCICLTAENLVLNVQDEIFTLKTDSLIKEKETSIDGMDSSQENQDRKHRTYVYVLTVTEILEDWEDSVSIGRKREWFKIEDAIKVLQCHKPVHAEYLEKLKLGGSPTNGNSVAPSVPPSDP